MKKCVYKCFYYLFFNVCNICGQWRRQDLVRGGHKTTVHETFCRT